MALCTATHRYFHVTWTKRRASAGTPRTHSHMALFFISILVIAVVIAAMAIGVLAGRAPGSCGGGAQRCEAGSRKSDIGIGNRDTTLYYPASR